MRGKTTDWLSVGVHDAYAVGLDVRGVGHVVRAHVVIVEHGIRRVTVAEGSVLDHEVGLVRRGSTVRAAGGPSPPARIKDDRYPPLVSKWCACHHSANGPRVCWSTKHAGDSYSVIFEVMRKGIPE